MQCKLNTYIAQIRKMENDLNNFILNPDFSNSKEQSVIRNFGK
jgi:hypothetical protein